MCQICERAAEGLDQLRQRHRDARPINTLQREAHGQLRSQIVRAEEDMARLRESLHGHQQPRVMGQPVRPDKYQVSLELS